MQAINIVGYTKSGKTRLVSALAYALEQQGLRIGIIKYSHHSFDKANTDTAKLAQKDRVLAGINKDETYMHFGYAMPIRTVLSQMPVDMVLIEGGKNLNFLPRILCLRPEDTKESPVESLGPLKIHLAIATHGVQKIHSSEVLQNIFHIPAYLDDGTGEKATTPEALQELTKLVRERAFILPALECGACEQGSCEKMATELIAKQISINQDSLKQCCALNTPISITINGQNIGLNPFTANLLYGAMNGMTGVLKGVSKGHAIVARWHQDKNTL